MNKSLRKKRKSLFLSIKIKIFSAKQQRNGGIPHQHKVNTFEILFSLPRPYMLTRSVGIITFSYSSLNFRNNENMNNDCRRATRERESVKGKMPLKISLNMCEFLLFFVACQNRRKGKKSSQKLRISTLPHSPPPFGSFTQNKQTAHKTFS